MILVAVVAIAQQWVAIRSLWLMIGAAIIGWTRTSFVLVSLPIYIPKGNKMKALLVIFALFASNAFAIGLGNDNPGSFGGDVTNVNTNLNSVSSRIDNDTRASALSYANPVAVSSGGGAAAQSGGSTSGVNFAITTPKNTPDLNLGNVYPTAPCMGSSQIGGSGVGFGFGIGTSWTDHECGKRETARSFNAMGLAADALAVLCSTEYAAVAPSCKPKE
jgi:hypothetical protein